MSQSTNVATSSSNPKRQYRKGNPLSLAEKKRLSVLRKKETHKELSVFIQKDYKEGLLQLCEDAGVTQAKMIEIWIARELAAKNVTSNQSD